MKDELSIAIETSCRAGGAALGCGDELIAAVDFDASARHAAQLISRLDALLTEAGARPGDLDQVYVSAGPGSFTGVRIGVTVARTLAQAVAGLRCVAVPTLHAVAYNARELDWDRLAVVADAKDDRVYTCTFVRSGDDIVPAGPAGVATEREFLAVQTQPITLIGEGLGYHDLSAPGAAIVPPDSPLHFPTGRGAWHVGRQMAKQGQFTEYHQLLPIYTRQPEAVRLWDQRNGKSET